jgi:hypothetical protein
MGEIRLILRKKKIWFVFKGYTCRFKSEAFASFASIALRPCVLWWIDTATYTSMPYSSKLGRFRSTIGIDDEQRNHPRFAECQCRYNYILFFFAGWFIAVQGLMSVGLALCLLSLLVATISLCCQKQNCSSSGTIAGLLLTTCRYLKYIVRGKGWVIIF